MSPDLPEEEGEERDGGPDARGSEDDGEGQREEEEGGLAEGEETFLEAANGDSEFD